MKLINNHIEIDFDVPDKIQKIINNIYQFAGTFQDSDDMNDETWLKYDLLLQELDITSKQYLSSGILTSSQRNKLMDRYQAW